MTRAVAASPEASCASHAEPRAGSFLSTAGAWIASPGSPGARLLVREEQTLLHNRPLHKRVAKDMLLRALFRAVSGLYIGEESRRYFVRYGVPEERFFFRPYCADNELLQRSAAELRTRRGELRSAPDAAGAMGRSARDLILREYTWRHYRQRVAAVYSELAR